MLYWFAGAARGYPGWLDSHPAGYVVALDRGFRLADMPHRPDGSVDLGYANYAPLHWVLHRATCGQVRTLGRDYTKICGTRDELDGDFEGEDVEACPLCL